MTKRELLDHVVDLLDERSTWRGLIALLTAAGVALKPDQVALIVSLGMAAGGFIGLLLKDRKPRT